MAHDFVAQERDMPCATCGLLIRDPVHFRHNVERQSHTGSKIANIVRNRIINASVDQSLCRCVEPHRIKTKDTMCFSCKRSIP